MIQTKDEQQRLLKEYQRGMSMDIEERLKKNPSYQSYGTYSKRSNSNNSSNSSNSQDTSSSIEDGNRNNDRSTKEIKSSGWLKSFALICTLLLAFGSHYASHALGTLKADVKKNLNISNKEYGQIQSTVALVNTILPLIGGVLVDKIGIEFSSLLATSLITFGTILTALSTQLNSFNWMVTGRFIYGTGSGIIVIVQGVIITREFKNSALSTVTGLKIITSRLASFLSMATVIPIAEYTHFYGNGFWLASFLCLVSLLSNILYIILTKRIKGKVDEKLNQKKSFSLETIYTLPKTMWLFCLISLTLSAGWNTFLHFNTELIQLRFNVSPSMAGYLSSASQLLPLFLPPLLGGFMDKCGNRMGIAISSGIAYTVSMYLLGFTKVHPLIGTLLFSYSLSSGPVSLLSGISTLVLESSVGTALGLYKSSMNIAASIQDVLVGYLQDQDQSNHLLLKNKDQYFTVMIFMTLVGIIGLIGLIVLFFVDRFFGDQKLDLPIQQLEEFEDEDTDSMDTLGLDQNNEHHPNFEFNKLMTRGFFILLIGSWIIFVRALF